MISNKRLGSNFERYVCDELSKKGWWAHFLSPNQYGAQPFDVIAIRGSHVMAIDCKTCKSKWFSYDRIETNQRLSFDALMSKSDKNRVTCGFMILHNDSITFLPYRMVIEEEKRGKHGYNLEENK